MSEDKTEGQVHGDEPRASPLPLSSSLLLPHYPRPPTREHWSITPSTQSIRLDMLHPMMGLSFFLLLSPLLGVHCQSSTRGDVSYYFSTLPITTGFSTISASPTATASSNAGTGMGTGSVAAGETAVFPPVQLFLPPLVQCKYVRSFR